MKKLLIILLAITALSCTPQELTTETNLAVGNWSLTDFTVDGITPIDNQINQGVLVLNSDGTGSGFTPTIFEWEISQGIFYLTDRFGGVRGFDVLKLDEVNLVLQIEQEGIKIFTFTRL